MADDHKHTEPLKTWFTEREFLDLNRLAAQEDRKTSELVRVIVRRFMYGSLAAGAADVHGETRADAGLLAASAAGKVVVA
jgi:hypothetical protein